MNGRKARESGLWLKASAALPKPTMRNSNVNIMRGIAAIAATLPLGSVGYEAVAPR